MLAAIVGRPLVRSSGLAVVTFVNVPAQVQVQVLAWRASTITLATQSLLRTQRVLTSKSCVSDLNLTDLQFVFLPAGRHRLPE